MQEYNFLEDYSIALAQDNVTNGAIIAHNVNFLLMILAVKAQPWSRDRLSNRVNTFS